MSSGVVAEGAVVAEDSQQRDQIDQIPVGAFQKILQLHELVHGFAAGPAALPVNFRRKRLP
jgi:hypothetical protein